MIDLTQSRKVLEDAWEMLEDLDGLELQDEAITTRRPGQNNAKAQEARAERAQASRDLLLLADALAAAEATVRQAYWKYKGQGSVFDPVTEARAL